MSVSSGGTDFVSHPPILMPKLAVDADDMCYAVEACKNYCDAAAVAGEWVLRVNRTRGIPGCALYAPLKFDSHTNFPFVRLQAEA